MRHRIKKRRQYQHGRKKKKGTGSTNFKMASVPPGIWQQFQKICNLVVHYVQLQKAGREGGRGGHAIAVLDSGALTEKQVHFYDPYAHILRQFSFSFIGFFGGKAESVCSTRGRLCRFIAARLLCIQRDGRDDSESLSFVCMGKSQVK